MIFFYYFSIKENKTVIKRNKTKVKLLNLKIFKSLSRKGRNYKNFRKERV